MCHFKFLLASMLATLAFCTSAQTPPAELEKTVGNNSSSEQAKNCLASQEKCEPKTELNRMQQSFRKACEDNPESCRYRQEKAQERRKAMANEKTAEN